MKKYIQPACNIYKVHTPHLLDVSVSFYNEVGNGTQLSRYNSFVDDEEEDVDGFWK